MKRKYICCLHKVQNQNGFILPFLLFVTTLSLIAISHSISIYQNTVTISSYHEESLVRDSLFQMAGEQVKTDLPAIIWDQPTVQHNYYFPQGEVKVIMSRTEDNQVECLFKINPLKGKATTKQKKITIP